MSDKIIGYILVGLLMLVVLFIGLYLGKTTISEHGIQMERPLSFALYILLMIALLKKL
jgi:hypothetical protein